MDAGRRAEKSGKGQPGRDGGRIDRPPRIEHRQPHRQERLGEIEPCHPATRRDPREQAIGGRVARNASSRRLPPERHEAHHEGKQKEGDRADDILPVDPPPPPPCEAQEHDRQDDRGGLRQQRQQKCHQRCGIPDPPARGIKPEPEQQGRGVEREREAVLQLRDPRHGSDRYRMDGEQDRPEPGPGNTKLPPDAPDQNRADRMQHQVDGPVARGVHAPEPPLEPEHRVGKRPVVLRLVGEPDAAQAAVVVDQAVRRRGGHGRDPVVVVPEKPAAQRRPEGQEHGQPDDSAAGQPDPWARLDASGDLDGLTARSSRLRPLHSSENRPANVTSASVGRSSRLCHTGFP